MAIKGAAAAAAGAAIVAVGAGGCASGPAAGATGTSCGQTRTGVNVPVTIMVAKGPADCAAAMRVEQGYAAAIRSGRLQGNGGGSPVTVDGWTCQAFPAAQVLRTGDASECHTTSAEVVAVLVLASPSASASQRT